MPAMTYLKSQSGSPSYSYHPHDLILTPNGVEDFFLPVSELEADHLARKLCLDLLARIQQSDIDENETAEAAWLVAIYLVLEATNLYQFAMIAQGCRQRDLTPSYTGGSGVLEALADRRAPDLPLTRFFLNADFPNAKFHSWLRWVASSLKPAPFSRCPPALIKHSEHILSFSADPWQCDLAAEQNKCLVLSRYEQWFGSDQALKTRLPDLSDQGLLKDLVQITENLFSEAGCGTQTYIRAALETSYRTLIQISLAGLKLGAQKAKYLPHHFWTNSMGGLHNRIIARLTQKRGGEVTTFDHGTGCGWMQLPELSLIEWDFCNRFISFSQAHQTSIKSQIRPEYKINRINPEVSISANPPYKPPLLSHDKKYDSTSPVIFYVPSIYALERYYIPPLSMDIAQIDFQVRLLGYLKNKGYQVVVKPHPECKVGIPSELIKLTGVQMETKSFELACRDADLVIMDYPQSTAFRSAILTDIPLVILDPERAPFRDEAKELLIKRASVLKIERDEHNRLQIDFPALDIAIKQAFDLKDKTFAETYYPLKHD